MNIRHVAIVFWYACLAAALWLHDWWSFLPVALGLGVYVLANSLSGEK